MLARTLSLLALTFAAACAAQEAPPPEIVCDGRYPDGHLQGLATNGEALYWSFTTTLVKTDLQGKLLMVIPVPNHHGDLCVVGGKVYVAWSNKFNEPGADSKVYIYAAEDLKLLEVKSIPEVTFGAGGMDYREERFYLVGGLPEEYEENYVYEYDLDFRFVKRHVLPSGHTNLGIQTACFHDGYWWFGCYGPGLIKADADLKLLGVYEVSPSIGLIGAGPGRFWMAQHFGENYQAKLVPMIADEQEGLVPAK